MQFLSPKLPIIKQAEATECGLASIAMVAAFHGHKVDLNGLRQRFSVSLKGATLRDLMNMADDLDLGTRALRLEVTRLKDLKLPAILHWDLNHFVVMSEVKGDKITIHDPGKGLVVLSTEEFSKHFTGVALEVTPNGRFRAIEAKLKAKLSDLWSRMTGLKRSFIQIIILSVVMQLFALASPFYMQMVIDEAVLSFDKQFLLVLALGFGFLYIINAVTELLRNWVILLLGQSMTFQMAGNVLHHLLRLPAEFFEKRHVGDVISRMQSVQPIQTALTQSVVAALIDSIMAIATAILIILYDWRLAMIAFVATALYIVTAMVTFGPRRRREEELISTMAKEQTHTIETIRAARAVKLFGREAEREAAWRNHYSDVINSGISTGKFDIGIGFSNTLLFGLQVVLIVYFGAKFILSGDMTVGMLFAFMAYRQNFADRAIGLVEKGIEFRMLNLHLERLSDIVQSDAEEGLEAPINYEREVRGKIEAEKLNFKYSPNEPNVFEDVDLSINPGEFIAITGTSGGGKTTLFKILLGLLPASNGEVRIDDLPIKSFGLRSWRAKTGVVMQDDQLLSGTIADNISFFDPEVDMQRVAGCAVAAQVHEDIIRMPMNYLSLVGDMGAALSGGQRQRLLIARALYRNPSVLFLDEGTANLDEKSEKQIGEILSQMPITRIVIAHRPELIRRADRVLHMEDGKLTEITADVKMREEKRQEAAESQPAFASKSLAEKNDNIAYASVVAAAGEPVNAHLLPTPSINATANLIGANAQMAE